MEKRKSLVPFIAAYTLFLIIGGLIGHQGRSIIVALSTMISALFIGAGGWMIWYEKNDALKWNLCFVAGLTLFFIYRWLLLKKFYPPGALTLISFLLFLKLWQAQVQQKKGP